MTTIELDGMNWTPVIGESLPLGAHIVVGGHRFVDLEKWPVFNDEKLKFLATILLPNDAETQHVLNVFIGSTEVESWAIEGAGNCVIVDGVAPEWVSLIPVTADVLSDLLYTDQEFTTSDAREEAEWLQGDETPEDFTYVAQIPSQVDGGELINIGDGYGTAYVFFSSETNSARVVWQS